MILETSEHMKMSSSENSTFSHMMCYTLLDIPPVVSHSPRAATPICTVVTTATEVNLDCQFWSLAVEHTVCVCVCVCVVWWGVVCVCVCISRGCHIPMHCIATTVKEVKILTVNVPVASYCVWMCVPKGGGHSHMHCSHNCDGWPNCYSSLWSRHGL